MTKVLLYHINWALMTWGGTDLFLAKLNLKHLEPTEYAWQLKVKHNLTRQQTLAIAPVVQCLQQMHSNRSNQMTHLADGVAQQPCRCGGLVEPVGAAQHMRQVGLGFAHVDPLHKVANVSPQSRLDPHSIRNPHIRRSPLERAIEVAVALILDELSMSPSDIYTTVQVTAVPFYETLLL